VSRATVGEAEGRPLLRRYAWLIVTVTVVTILAASTLAALRPSTYSASSSVVVEPARTAGTAFPPEMGIEEAFALSGEVARRAAHRLGLPAEVASQGLSVSVPIESNILNISYSASSPQQALKGAIAFTRAYVTYRNSIGAPAPVAQLIAPPTLPTHTSGTDWNLFG
jgi:capsular polysaccharide biosynthesis protein